jgi:hypothetical protein
MTSIRINVEIPDLMIEDIIDVATIGYWGRIYRGTTGSASRSPRAASRCRS